MKAPHARNECVPDAPKTIVALSVWPGRLLKVRLSAGDVLRVERGLLWYTIDGRLDDFFVKGGAEQTIAEDITLSVTGFGKTDFALISSRPLPRFARRGGVQPYGRRRRLAAALSAGWDATRGAAQSLVRRMRPARLA